jgi:carbohydrate diacid regulator
MLTREIAEAIVKETMTRLNRNINIMDKSGIIIASGDPSRIKQVHEGALEVIRKGRPLIITNENKNQWIGSLSGINLPIEFQNKIVGVIGITGEPKEVEEFGDLVKMLTELMIKQSYLASQSEWQQRTKEMIIEELINSDPKFEIIDQRLNLLHLQLHPPFSVSIIEIKERTIQNQVLVKKIEDMISEGQYLVGFLNVNRLFILISGLSENKTKKKLLFVNETLQRMGIQFKIGYAAQVHEQKNISIAYQESDLALLIGDDEQQLIPYSDIETKALVFQLDEALKQRYLKRIFPKASVKVIQTLQTFFECNLNIAETAKALFIHRNTLIYRLKKIKEESGYDPQIFKDAVPLQLAIWMNQKASKTFNPNPK